MPLPDEETPPAAAPPPPAVVDAPAAAVPAEFSGRWCAGGDSAPAQPHRASAVADHETNRKRGCTVEDLLLVTSLPPSDGSEIILLLRTGRWAAPSCQRARPGAVDDAARIEVAAAVDGHGVARSEKRSLHRHQNWMRTLERTRRPSARREVVYTPRPSRGVMGQLLYTKVVSYRRLSAVLSNPMCSELMEADTNNPAPP
jgi:hypothetical protein